MIRQFIQKDRQASQAFIMVTIFLDVLGIGLIIPVLPALVGEFTTSPDEQARWYGLLSATYGVMQFFCMPLLGALSDRFGRRPVLLLSVFGLGCSFLVHALATSLTALFLIRILSGGTAASFSVANAYMADITAPAERAKAFGKIGAAFGFGFIVGPMLGGLLGAHDLRLPFYVAAVMAIANFLYGFFVLPESLPLERRAAFSLSKANPFTSLLNLGRLHAIGGLIAAYALTTFAQFILQMTWVLYLSFRFGWGPSEAGFTLFFVGLTSVVVQGVLQGRLIRALGEVRLVHLGMISSLVAFVCYGLVTQAWLIYVIICANLLSFCVAPILQSMVSKSVGPSEQGVTQGSLNAINSLAIIFTPLMGSYVLAEVGHLSPDDWRMGATFFLSAGFQLVALIVAVAHFRRVAQQAPTDVAQSTPPA